MKTASFFTFQGPGRISIARFAPRGTPAGFRIYKALAPGEWFNSVSPEEYRRRFFAQLAALDAAKVRADLEHMASPAEPVLLCWEKPPFTEKNWCHRRMVAEWFKEKLGIEVEETKGVVMMAEPAERTAARIDPVAQARARKVKALLGMVREGVTLFGTGVFETAHGCRVHAKGPTRADLAAALRAQPPAWWEKLAKLARVHAPSDETIRMVVAEYEKG
ncbi:MAG: hypothetical protein AMXMBFR56_65830 [Polyangiaceae bacterium]